MVTAAGLSALLGGRLEGCTGEEPVRGIGSLLDAGVGEVAVLHAEPRGRLRSQLIACRAGLLVAGSEFELPEEAPRSRLRVADPGGALLVLIEHFHNNTLILEGIHPSAVVAADAHLGAGVSVGPLCVVGAAASIGAGSVLGAQVYVEDGVQVGRGTRLESGCRLLRGTRIGDGVVIGPGSVIGSAGFGLLAPDGAGVRRPIPQVGGVRIDDGARIGALCAVDRGTFGDTQIGAHARLDNLIQVGHNAAILAGAVLCGQVGVAGSVTIGRGALLGGQAGVVDHKHVGDGAVLLARAAAFRDVPAGQIVGGAPARPRRQWLAERATLARLTSRRRTGLQEIDDER